MRDLKEQGYGPRLIGAIEKGKRLPRQPRGHDRDLRVVHQARGRHQPRRLRRGHLRRGPHRARRAHGRDDPPLQPPDLHRHDGHRPAAAEARRRRLPGRGRRLPAGRRRAPRRRRAAARAARQARARACATCPSSAATTTSARWPRRSTTRRSTWPPRCYYRDRFGHRAGIVYAAGVDHAERVAAAMRADRAASARSVSGRTPPRALAATLAAYERGEINVLVNAQLLAEGWNAPRATICMHLAPTASRRVYQQRIGRVMRLHRRKEAGVVVDFVDPAAPHSDRTVTLHSLLDVDLYRPGALVTPQAAAPPAALAPPGAAGAARRRVADPGRPTIPAPPARGHRRALEDGQRRPPARSTSRSSGPRPPPGASRPPTCRGSPRRSRRSARRRASASSRPAPPSASTARCGRIALGRPRRAPPRHQHGRPHGAPDRGRADLGRATARRARACCCSAIAAGTLAGSQSQRADLDVEARARLARDAVPRRDRRQPGDPRPAAHARLLARRGAPRAGARCSWPRCGRPSCPSRRRALAAALTHDAIAARTIELARAELGADVEALAARVRLEPARAEGRAARQGAPRAQEAQGAPGREAQRRRGQRQGRDASRRDAEAAASAERPSEAPRDRRPTARRRASAAVAAAAARAPARRGGAARAPNGAEPPARRRRAAAERRAPAHGRGAGQRRDAGGEARASRAAPPPRRAPSWTPPRSACRRRPRTAERGAEGHHPGRRVGHAALPGDARRLQAAAAGLRQADDLLPAEHADARGHPRDPGDHDAARRARPSSSCSATAPHWGLELAYAQQPSPDGLAQALLIARDFLAGAPSCLVLGDNIFYGHGLTEVLRAASARETRRDRLRLLGARPRALRRRRVRRRRPRDRARGEARRSRSRTTPSRPLLLRRQRARTTRPALAPSPRGELEITDLNRRYLERGELMVERLGRGYAWLDTGHARVAAAGRELHRDDRAARRASKVACPEEIAFQNGWIDARPAARAGRAAAQERLRPVPARARRRRLRRHGLDVAPTWRMVTRVTPPIESTPDRRRARRARCASSATSAAGSASCAASPGTASSRATGRRCRRTSRSRSRA